MKAVAKQMLRSFGFELRRIPDSVKVAGARGLVHYRTSLGEVYLPVDAPQDSIASHMRRGEIFEPEVVELARRFIRPGTVVLDLGANFGQMTMLFAREVGADGLVYAFEAQQRVFDILSRNIEANDIKNVRPMFNAVLNESGRVFHFPDPDWSRFGTYGSFNLPLDAKAGAEVASIKVDDLSFDRPVSFIKVDVQGCDLFAMQGAKATIAKHRMPIVFEFEQRFQADYGTSFQDYVDFTGEIGYVFKETVLDINYLIVPREAA